MTTRKSGMSESGAPNGRGVENEVPTLCTKIGRVALRQADQALQPQQSLAEGAGEIVEPGRERVVAHDAGRSRQTHGNARMSGRCGSAPRGGIAAIPARGAKAPATASSRDAVATISASGLRAATSFLDRARAPSETASALVTTMR